jgi:hypothetical protein
VVPHSALTEILLVACLLNTKLSPIKLRASTEHF